MIIISSYSVALSIQILIGFWLSRGSPILPYFLLAPLEYLFLFYGLLGAGTILTFNSKAIGQRIAKKAWLRIQKEHSPTEEVDDTVLYLVKDAMPYYLFYGVVWLFVIIIPFSGAYPQDFFFLGIIAPAFFCLVLIVLGWIVKIWIVQSRVMNRKHNRIINLLMKSGGLVMEVVRFASLGFALVLFFILAPTFTFGPIIQTGMGYLPFANAINVAMILILVQSLSKDSMDKDDNAPEENNN